MSRTNILLVLLVSLCAESLARDAVTPARPLIADEVLVSADGTFALGFFTPSNGSGNKYVGIWYNKIKVRTIVWVANRYSPIISSTPALLITANGTLAVGDHNSTIIILSSTAEVIANPVARLLDTGNFAVFDENSNVAWQSFDHPTDTMLPGMKLGVDIQAGLNRNLTAWKSDADPSPGDVCVAMDIRGDPQLTVFFGDVKRWRSGPWTGNVFNGIPEMGTYTSNGFSFDFINTNKQIYYTYDMSNRSILTRLVANNTGKVQRWVWLGNVWGLFWFMPSNACEYSKCGSYSYCDFNANPICGCLPGFEPKSPARWRFGDWADGCARKNALDCANGTDGFEVVAGAMLPDTSNATVELGLGIGECRARCLMKCSCSGYASADVRGNGSGCILWTGLLLDLQMLRLFENGGQDFYVRVSSKDLASSQGYGKSHVKGSIVAVITVSILGGFLLFLCVFCHWIRRKRRIKGIRLESQTWSTRRRIGEGDGRMEDVELPLIDSATLMVATGGFSSENVLGQGGFGPVYKGKMGDGQEIAVKRLSKNSVQGIEEFKNEVMLIAKLQHRNLVRLLGYCIQGDDIMLIYEYMPNRSLDAYLFDKENGAMLAWKMRFNIIAGIARGLLYLHQDSRYRIIHRDLKASNILLDRDMNPKISDFGMARISGGDETITKTRRVVGTYGYMSPEYAMDGIFSVKSDVYSYGVLVLEIISGMRNKGVFCSKPELYLLGNAWRLWNEGRSLELVDSSMGSSFSTAEVLRCMHIGLLCVQECPEDRPTMQSVVFMIDDPDSLLPRPKHPGFVAKGESSELSSSSIRDDVYSVDDKTISVVAGR